ncbi:MAG: dethiobiotin synthase [Bacteroidetes bacterium]|nr:dethiobiotin synthase [Bacteroidota bacterium]
MGKFFVTGIGTGIGKTYVSSVLTEALKADYWKPVQCGTSEGTDTEKIRELISNSESVLHKEGYCFKEPVSPHIASASENVKIKMDGMVLPHIKKHLIIEGAGGLMVPLNDDAFAIDLAKEFEAEVILVCRNYLGCINHSLLSIDYLLRNEFSVKGIILNGNFDKAVRSAIINYSELPVLAEFPEINIISKETVYNQSRLVNISLFADEEE